MTIVADVSQLCLNREDDNRSNRVSTRDQFVEGIPGYFLKSGAAPLYFA